MVLDTQALTKVNVLDGIESYSSKMSLSKVITYFERQNVFFTKTMIQNYVRVGVLPKPDGRRWYTKKHLVALVLINDLKNIYSLTELAEVLTPLFEKDEFFDYLNYLKVFINVYNDTLVEENDNLISIESDEETRDYANIALAAKTSAIKNLLLENS